MDVVSDSFFVALTICFETPRHKLHVVLIAVDLFASLILCQHAISSEWLEILYFLC